MNRLARFEHQFVEVVPDILRDGILYVSIPFATVVHRCACGCGNEVVTPLSPTDWTLTFDGVAISLRPSIGNWSFSCRSHYWITFNRIDWASQWTAHEIRLGRKLDQAAKAAYFAEQQPTPRSADQRPQRRCRPSMTFNLLSRIKGWFS